MGQMHSLAVVNMTMDVGGPPQWQLPYPATVNSFNTNFLFYFYGFFLYIPFVSLSFFFFFAVVLSWQALIFIARRQL